MADIYNVIRGDGVFFEGMTKEQIFELIAEMTGETVQDIDQAFITKLKEINKGNSIRLWLGTTAEYNGLSVKEDNVLYICTDDTFVPDTNLTLQNLVDKVDANNDSVIARLDAQDIKIDEFIESIGKACTLIDLGDSPADSDAQLVTIVPRSQVKQGMIGIQKVSTDNKYMSTVFSADNAGLYAVIIVSEYYSESYYSSSDSYGWSSVADGPYHSDFKIVTGNETIGSQYNTGQAGGRTAYMGSVYVIYWKLI